MIQRSFRVLTIIATCLLLQGTSFSCADDSPNQLPSKETVLQLFQPGEFQSESGGSISYRMMEPDLSSANESATKKYPLVLFLHGAGERGDDNTKQLAHAAADFARPDRRDPDPAFVVFPQCPAGQQWVDTPWDLPNGDGTFGDSPSKPLALALELIESIKTTYPIDLDRVYVTGLSMGGYGAWHAGGLHPERFAALLPVCGGSDPTWAGRYKGLPIWSFHGDQDKVVPFVRGREIISALALAGHQPELRYTEYAGVSHNSWTRTFARDDVHDWLFSQRRIQKADK